MIKLSPSDKKLLALLLLIFTIIFSVVILDFVLNSKMIFKHTSGVERSSSSLEQKIQNAIRIIKKTRKENGRNI